MTVSRSFFFLDFERLPLTSEATRDEYPLPSMILAMEAESFSFK